MSNTINKQTAVTPELSDLIVIWDTGNGSTRRTSLSYLLSLFQDNLTFTDLSPTTQYSAPLTGTTVAITDGSDDIHLILTPAGTIATLTITLPLNTNLVDKQEIIVNSTQIVTTLTIDSNSATLSGTEASWLDTANNYFTLKYDLTLDTWYRIG